MTRLKTLFHLWLLIVLPFPLYSQVIIDYSDIPYTKVISQLTNIGYEHVDAVIVRHPFWHLHGKKDKGYGVYHWDTSLYVRAQETPSAGSIPELKDLAATLKQHKIKIYSRIDPFIQLKDYNREWWSLKDFTDESVLYNKHYLVSPAGAGQLTPLFRAMKSLPIDKWIVHVDEAPEEIRNVYGGIARSGLGNRLMIYTSFTNRIGNHHLLHAWDYWTLRQGPFLTPVPKLSQISNYSASDYTHIVDSDSLTINNIATAVYMISQGIPIVLPASFSRNKGIARMIRILQSDEEFQLKLLSEETMLLYNSSQIISFHLGDELNMVKIPAITRKEGQFNSVVGNSILYSREGQNYFLLFPGSVYLWDLK